MIKALLTHQIRQQLRSPIWAKNLLANILLGFAGILMAIYALMLGIFLPELFERLLPDLDPVTALNRYLLYYFALEFMIRFFLQKSPVMSIAPYLHLPITKSKLIHFMLGKSQMSIFNLFVVLLFSPYAIRVISPEFGNIGAIAWLAGLFAISMSLHFLLLLLKKKLTEQPIYFWGTLIVFTVLYGLDYFEIFAFSAISESLFSGLLNQQLWSGVTVLAWIMLYLINFRFYVANIYPEELVHQQKDQKITGSFAFLNKFGRIGDLIGLELKLILRHKRPRNALVLSAFFLFYGLIFYPTDTYQEGNYIFLFIGLFITGVFFLNYGQFLLSWEGSYFDGILTRKLDFRTYLEAKYYLFLATSTLAFILSLGYGWFGLDIVWMNFAAFLYNIGINIFMVMRIAMYKPKKIDLNKRAVFNYEGTGAAQYLIIIPVVLVPYAIYLPFALTGLGNYGLAILAIVGLVGFFMRERWLDVLTKAFIHNRHRIAGGFRAQ